MARALTLVLALLWSACAAAASADEYAGVVKTTRGAVSIERAGARLPAPPGTRLQQGDRIVTAADGYVGATMRDDTLITLGPNGVLALDAFAFDAKTHEGSFVASLTKGVLSVVTGLIPRRSPQSFAVKTPISTMGVRGTEFIVEAGEI